MGSGLKLRIFLPIAPFEQQIVVDLRTPELSGSVGVEAPPVILPLSDRLTDIPVVIHLDAFPL